MSCPKCGSSDKHFCPPSLGEPGFYLCECRAPASPALAEAAREVLAYRETAKEANRVHVELHNQNVAPQAEVARLTDCLKTANGHHEHFERRWYLCQDRIAELEAIIERTNKHEAHRLEVERRDATEAALRWAWDNSDLVDDSQFVDEVVRVGIKALLGEGEK